MNFGIIHLAAVKRLAEKGRTLFSNKYLLYTNTALCVTLSTSGDFIQQYYQIAKKEQTSWQKIRSRNVATTGLVIGPICHYWYIFLDRWLPGRTFRIITKKILVDQLICSPVVIGLFLSVIAVLERQSWKEMKAEMCSKGSTLYTAEWVVWPPAQIINFYFLPTRYRMLYDNTISLGFDIYFSYVKYSKKHSSLVASDDTSSSKNLNKLPLEESKFGHSEVVI